MFFLMSLILFLQTLDIPFKPKEDFAVGVDLKFKAKPTTNNDAKVTINEYSTRPQGTMSAAKAAYLHLKIELTKLTGKEVRAKVINQEMAVIYNRKVKQGGVILLDVGFLDEIKDRPADTQFECILLSEKKEPVSKIDILIEKSGTYFVNGVRLGKF